MVTNLNNSETVFFDSSEDKHNVLERLRKVKDINSKIHYYQEEEENIWSQIKEYRKIEPPLSYEKRKKLFIEENYNIYSNPKHYKEKLKNAEIELQLKEDESLSKWSIYDGYGPFRICLDLAVICGIGIYVLSSLMGEKENLVWFAIVPLAIRIWLFLSERKNKSSEVNSAKASVEKAKKELIKAEEELGKKEVFFDTHYNEIYKEEKERYEKAVSTIERLQSTLNQLHNERVPIINNLNKERKTLINESYFEDIDNLIEIIEAGRADSLIEALNVLEGDKRANRLIMLQEEYNENQRIEIERNRRIQEQEENERRRQTEETARHNREMERAEQQRAKAEEERAKHDRYMAEQRYKEQQRKERQDAWDAKMDGHRQCISCINRPSCGVVFSNKGNCAAYRPK